MALKYPDLFQPFYIGKLCVKNRICMSGMHNIGWTDGHDIIDDKVIDYFEERAKGGVGLIFTGAVQPDFQFDDYPTMANPFQTPGIFISQHKKLADRVHSYGAKLFIQLGYGGGSACDSSKAIAMGAVYEGDVWDLFDMSGKLAPEEKIIPVAAVVTYPATGSEAGVTAVVNNEKIIRKTWAGHEKARPHFAFMDPQYTMTLPRHLLINGMCDIMAHHTDRYMTDDAHFGVFDNLLESAMHYLRTELMPTILDPDKDNLIDRTELMAIADMGVNEFIAWGRNKENASHQLGHSIGAMYDVIHGSTLSIIYCSWLPYVYKDNVLRVARWAEKVWDVAPDPEHPEKVAEEGLARMKQWFISLGMPTCFADLGIHPTEDELQHMTDMTAIAMGSDHIGVMKKLYREDILQIYRNAL